MNTPLTWLSRLLVLISLQLLIADPLTSAPPPASPIDDSHSFRLITVAGSYRDLYYTVSPGATPTPVILNQVLSCAYPRPTSATLELFRQLPPPPDSPPGTPPVRQTVITASLPSGMIAPIVIVPVPDPHTAAARPAAVVADDPKTHQPATLRIFNYSNSRIGVAAGAIHYTIEPNAEKIIPISEADGRVMFQVAAEKNGRWVGVLKNEHRLSSALRGYLMVFDYVRDPDFPPELTPPPLLANLMFGPTSQPPSLRTINEAGARVSLKNN